MANCPSVSQPRSSCGHSGSSAEPPVAPDRRGMTAVRGSTVLPPRRQVNCFVRQRGQDVRSCLDIAKQVLAANEAVLYGIFGVIGSSGYFPPRDFLNDFLRQGTDPCDQDGRMSA